MAENTRIRRLHMEMIKLYAGDPKRIQHFCKVYNYAKLIAEMEGVEQNVLYTLEAAALTHDIGIHISEAKYGDCSGKHQEEEGPVLAQRLLHELGFEEKTSERVQYLIAHHHTYAEVKGIDYQILIEADFLVNLYEDGLSKDAVKKVYDDIFKTETGRKICREMFDIAE